jgi:AcrR family transcriptional regulator
METPLQALVTAATPEQRETLASPLRLEIYGHFSPSEPLSVRELARRTGRSASSLYYHVHRLMEVDLLREAGERPRGPRTETLYTAAGPGVRLEPDGSPEGRDALLRTMAAGFRMAERDLEAALAARAEDTDAEPPFATRLHVRMTPEELEEVRGHLRAALELLLRLANDPPHGPEAGSHYSLTLALLPLRGRDEEDS